MSNYDRQWRKIRAHVLERDGYRCQIRGEGCTGKATEVDHILPVSKHGFTRDPELLRASCRHCNRSRGNGEKPVGNRTSKRYPGPSREW